MKSEDSEKSEKSEEPENDEDHDTVVSTPEQQVNRAVSGSPPLSGWRLYVVQFCLCFGLFLAVMEMSIVSTALITIAKQFDDYIRINWIVLAYLLTYMGFAVFLSRVSDVIGRKWAVVTSLTIFSVFSLACGLAQSLTQLIAFRALQGVGGSGLYAMTMVILPEITPRSKLAAISGYMGAVFGSSSILGPILGGVITSQASWRWVFLINVPCGCAALAAVLICWPGPGRTLAKRVSWKQVDYTGAFLLMTGSILLVFALQQGGSASFAWNSPIIIATLVIAACSWVGFGLWIWLLSTRNGVVNPIFSPRIVTQRVMAVVVLDTFLTGFTFILLIIQLPERFQIVNGNTPELAGIHLLPLLISSACASGIGGVIQSRKNYTFYTLVVANSLILLGCGLLSTLPDSIDIENAQYGFQVIYGFGVGLTLSTVTIMTVVNTTPADTAVAQGAVAQSRVFGGSVGLAIAALIFNSHAVADLDRTLSQSQINALRKSLTAIHTFSPSQRRAVVAVFATSFTTQMRVCTYVATASLVVSLAAFQKRPISIMEKRRAVAMEVQRAAMADGGEGGR